MSEVRAELISNRLGNGPAPLRDQWAARSRCNFNGTGTVAIRSSGNVSSITDNGTGNYTGNFTAAMPDTNYAYIGTASLAGTLPNMIFTATDTDVKTASAFQMRTGSTSPSATHQDGGQVSFAVHP